MMGSKALTADRIIKRSPAGICVRGPPGPEISLDLDMMNKQN